MSTQHRDARRDSLIKFISCWKSRGCTKQSRVWQSRIAVVLCWLLLIAPVSACTTAVISGRVTRDGRPILWKNRDYASAPRNEVVLLTDGTYRVLAVVNAGSRKSVWMGTNEAGLCMENSLSTDLDDADDDQGLGNGSFMRLALQTCATVQEVKQLLEQTNASGRTTTANFGVIDAQGGAAIFETGPNSFEMFDANDPAVAPEGYLVRSNFSTVAQELPSSPSESSVSELRSGDRYARACRLLEGAPDGSIDVAYLIHYVTRDLAGPSLEALPGSLNADSGTLPEWIPTANTISRSTTVSAAVFHGVKANEDPRFTTMWVALGDPKFSVAVPCWASLESIADELQGEDGGEIGELARLLRDASLNVDGESIRGSYLLRIWNDALPLEREILEQTQTTLERLRSQDFSANELFEIHQASSARAYQTLHGEMMEAKSELLQRPSTHHPSASTESLVRVAIYDHSDGSANGPKNLLRILTTEAGFEARRVTPVEIREGVLDEVDVLIMPGGSGSAQAERLEETGKEAIKSFVDQGGGYVGICAGSYLASSHYRWSLGLINARVWDRAHWARGTGTVELSLSDSGKVALQHESNQASVYYGQGPLLLPGEHPQLPAYEVLAEYDSEVVKNGAIEQAMQETHAIIRSVFGAGRVVCISPHPETTSGPNHFILHTVRWAAGANEQ